MNMNNSNVGQRSLIVFLMAGYDENYLLDKEIYTKKRMLWKNKLISKVKKKKQKNLRREIKDFYPKQFKAGILTIILG